MCVPCRSTCRSLVGGESLVSTDKEGVLNLRRKVFELWLNRAVAERKAARRVKYLMGNGSLTESLYHSHSPSNTKNGYTSHALWIYWTTLAIMISYIPAYYLWSDLQSCPLYMTRALMRLIRCNISAVCVCVCARACACMCHPASCNIRAIISGMRHYWILYISG